MKNISKLFAILIGTMFVFNIFPANSNCEEESAYIQASEIFKGEYADIGQKLINTTIRKDLALNFVEILSVDDVLVDKLDRSKPINGRKHLTDSEVRFSRIDYNLGNNPYLDIVMENANPPRFTPSRIEDHSMDYRNPEYKLSPNYSLMIDEVSTDLLIEMKQPAHSQDRQVQAYMDFLKQSGRVVVAEDKPGRDKKWKVGDKPLYFGVLLSGKHFGYVESVAHDGETDGWMFRTETRVGDMYLYLIKLSANSEAGKTPRAILRNFQVGQTSYELKPDKNEKVFLIPSGKFSKLGFKIVMKDKPNVIFIFQDVPIEAAMGNGEMMFAEDKSAFDMSQWVLNLWQGNPIGDKWVKFIMKGKELDDKDKVLAFLRKLGSDESPFDQKDSVRNFVEQSEHSSSDFQQRFERMEIIVGMWKSPVLENVGVDESGEKINFGTMKIK